jgi:hypothetical protein
VPEKKSAEKFTEAALADLDLLREKSEKALKEVARIQTRIRALEKKILEMPDLKGRPAKNERP